MKTIKLFVILTPVSLLILYSAALMYVLPIMSVETIIICASSRERTHYIPSKVCEFYLFNFRSSEKDIQELADRAGLMFLTGILDTKKRYIYADHFLSKGILIDAPSRFDGFSPLQGAILSNDLELVKYLISRGASLNQIDEKYGLTPLNFLKLVVQKRSPYDLTAISDFLTSASSQPQ